MSPTAVQIDQSGRPLLAVALCWAVLVVVWLAGAVHNARHAPPARRRRRLGPAWPLGAAGYLLLRWAIPEHVWTTLTVHSTALGWAGAAMLLGATGFALWARAVLGTMWTSAAVVKEGHELRTDGPYRITRHPIYTGLLGMVAATALAAGLGRWIGVTLFALALLLVKIRAEERLLESALGEQYRDYRRRVPMLLPLPRRPVR